MLDQEEYVQCALRSAKQKFLTAEILNLHYDSEAFLAFCQSKKSSDIDEWTLEELDSCVNDFKKLYKPIEASQSCTETSCSSPCLATDPLEKIRNAIGQVPLSIIQVDIVKTNELNSLESIKIEVVGAEIVNSGLFAIKCYVFTINTEPINWRVKRKAEEFIWIREMLVRDFPGIYIPPIPKSGKAKLSLNSLYKRGILYTNFLNNTASNQLLRTSPLLLAFLKEPDLKLHTQAAKKPKSVTKITRIKSLQSEIPCLYEELLDKYENVLTFLVKSDKILIELIGKFKKLIFDSLCLAETVKNYTILICQCKENYVFIRNFFAVSIYNDLEESMISWADYLVKSTKGIYEDLILPIKAYKIELLALREIVKKKDIAFDKYRNNCGKGGFNDFKDIYGFVNCACIEQCEKVASEALWQLQRKLMNGFVRKSEESLRFHVIWGELLSKISSKKVRNYLVLNEG